MKSLTKLSLVVLGYVIAWLIADQALAIHVAHTATDRQGADGMYAFGDSLLFLGVFGLIALVPTSAAIYFLRASNSLWSGLSTMAPAIGVTAPVAVFLSLVSHWAATSGALAILFGLAVLRLLVSPLLFCAFLLCGVLALPSSQKKLLVASGLEAVAMVYIVFFWFLARH